ncbi:MAG: hypothetical protein JNM18_04125, partial [Planctomycetaceae bacterium]|nr:hypothetical protein [Planctomycetaceae bacterium]
MNRSRVALSLLMMVYVLSLLAVGQADDHRKRRVTGSAPMKTAAPVGEASSAIAPAGDSFTYYGPDDAAIADESALAEEAFPYAASELAETPEYLLGGNEFTAATADEFVESLGVDAPPEYQAEYLRDAQANENVAPLPPVEIAETREPAPVDMLNEELANSASESADMDLSVDTVLFDTLGQTDDTDEAFYARQQTLAPSPETPVDTCPHFHGCTNGIRCPLIDRCRELMQQWQPQEPAKSVEIETLAEPVVEPVAVTESPRAVSPYSGEYGPSYDLE